MPETKVLYGDCRAVLPTLAPESFHLCVTSPPYNLGKEYETELDDVEYMNFLAECFRQVYRVLKPSGRICVNVPLINPNQRGDGVNVPIYQHTYHALTIAGFKYRDTVMWEKNN